MEFPFLKMHGAANDFVVVDHRAPFLPDGASLETLVARLCDRRRGVGADGVLMLERDPELDFAMRYHNADGKPADYCGNGARCLARFALDLGLGRDGRVRFRTAAGVQEARAREDGVIAVHFGHVRAPGAPRALAAAGRTFEGRYVVAGVPHFVVPVERVEWVPLADWAPPLRHHAEFAPAGANVDFIATLGERRIAMRTWERGVEGETLACGSGAIASAVATRASGARARAATNGAGAEPETISVLTAGGDELWVTLHETDGGLDAWLAGPAETAFTGRWSERTAIPSAS